jgi:hypothetical protein
MPATMTFDSASLLLRLLALQQQITASPRHRAALRETRRGADRFTAVCAAIDAEHYARSMVVTTERIRARVVPSDGLGDALESLSELVLRAVRMVVLAELCTLGELVGTSTAAAGLVLSVRAELNRVTEQWLRSRETASVDRAVYRSALREAHAAIQELGTTSDFAGFLDSGLNRSSSPSFQAACARTLVALTLSINVEPDVPVVVVSWPPRRVKDRAS